MTKKKTNIEKMQDKLRKEGFTVKVERIPESHYNIMVRKNVSKNESAHWSGEIEENATVKECDAFIKQAKAELGE